MRDKQRSITASRVIHASPETIFSLLIDPAKHPLIDGSGTVKAPRNDEPLALGSKFGMDMRFGLPYRISNEVVEFEANRRIAWRHFGRHIWRYELEPVADGTRVTETFDWSVARSPRFVEAFGWPKRNATAMERTLERIESVVAKPD